MAKKSIQLLYAAIFLSLILITTTAFINKGKELTSGGGIAGGHLFNYTAAENNSVVTGRFLWDGTEYNVVCVNRDGSTAIIYLSNEMAVRVIDNKTGDQITAPFAASQNCSMATIARSTAIDVDGGNLTVHK